MLSRRNFLAGTLAIGAASRLHAQAGDTAPTVLRIETACTALAGFIACMG